MHKIVVTGGAGFIGSHLVEHLLMDEDNHVIVVDNFTEGNPQNLPKNKRLRVHEMSILDRDFGKGREFENVDIVYHLAALTRPRWSIKYPTKTNNVNVGGTLRVLEWCVKKGVGKLVYTSSASAYGKQKKLLLKEDMKLNPMSPYALTKQIGENYCNIFGELYNLNYGIVRPFNVYGPRQSLNGGYSAAVPNFIYYLKHDKTPYITGNGKQKRDFVYVKDVVRLMDLVGKFSGPNETFNAGSGRSTSLNAVYKKICKSMNVKKQPNYVSEVVEPQTKAHIDKAKNLLNWNPEFDLDGGLNETIRSEMR